MTKKIKICFFGDAQSVHTQRWVSEIAKRGFEVVLISKNFQHVPGVKVIVLSGNRNKLSWFLKIWEIRCLMKQIKPDIVHGHYITSYGFWAKASGIKPLVQTAWGSDILVSPFKSRMIRVLTQWALGEAALITADSLDTLDLTRTYSNSARFEQVQWGVDLNLFKPAEQVSEPVRNIVSLRGLNQNYNIDIIIKAFAKVRQNTDNIKLTIAGFGPLNEELQNLTKKLGIEKDIQFVGQLDEVSLARLLSTSTVSVTVPSSDATSMSLLESMASGLPVIASDLPANRQWIFDQNCIVPVGDVDALAKALEKILADPVNSKSLGDKNRDLVSKNASRQIEMDRMAHLYLSLL
ncbi:glycosyltransferase [Bdellovibrio sp. NC01]|uniref:glycosyltransferase n=1 Tax=Bdellovibrio sp. NC01 TaxID=2220073 RepID=UPI0011582F22|nr:glycosyltransferase [Bdellovibrio sp. NC01]QDK37510.1 glycosyl transferase family 1 [Bdellovibrio sp. NC01]